VQGRRALRRDLTACLRTGRALRAPRDRARTRGKHFVTPEIMISERPAEVEDRAVPGHWEGDLILGLDSSAIGTLVERTTRFTMLLHLPRLTGHGDTPRTKNGPALAGHGAEAVRDAIAAAAGARPGVSDRKAPLEPLCGRLGCAADRLGRRRRRLGRLGLLRRRDLDRRRRAVAHPGALPWGDVVLLLHRRRAGRYRQTVSGQFLLRLQHLPRPSPRTGPIDPRRLRPCGR